METTATTATPNTATTTSRAANRRGRFSFLAVSSVLAGILLTLNNIGVISGIWRLWPICPAFLGLGGIWLFNRGERRDLKPLGIGTYLLSVSLLFFFLNYTTWSHMAQAWPAFIGAFGISLLTITYFAENRKWLVISGLFFLFLSLVFFMVFTIDSKLWPISLMLFGIWLLVIPERETCAKKRSPNCRTSVE